MVATEALPPNRQQLLPGAPTPNEEDLSITASTLQQVSFTDSETRLMSSPGSKDLQCLFTGRFREVFSGTCMAAEDSSAETKRAIDIRRRTLLSPMGIY